MQSFVKLVVGLFLLWLPIAAVLYLISNGPVGEAKDAEITHLVANTLRLVDDSKDRIEERESQAGLFIKLKGGDGGVGIYKALKRKEKVTDLQASIISSVAAKDGSLDKVRITFGYNNLKVAMVVMVVNQRSFTRPYAIDALGVEDISIEGAKKHSISSPEAVANFLFDVAISKGIQMLDSGNIVTSVGGGLPNN